MREIIRTGWQGKVSLAKAFWGNFVLGQFLVAAAIIVLFSPAQLFGDQAVEAVKFITWPLYHVFLVWAMVGIWRCAPNTKHPAFSMTAKVFVVLYSLLWVFAFLQEQVNVV